MYSYIVKVKGKTFLWGSSGLATSLDWPLLLVIQNDAAGDPIELGSIAGNPGDPETNYGTLEPKECWTLPLLGLRGVFANCDADSSVACTILLPALPPP